jgi:hypothetical protein
MRKCSTGIINLSPKENIICTVEDGTLSGLCYKIRETEMGRAYGTNNMRES